jgi:hypothetical protein
MTSTERRADGTSVNDRPITGIWPKKRVIWSCQADRGPLLVRYFLIQTRWFAVFLHKLCASDEDRALHDHPWSFVTFLFHRGYWEHCEEQSLDHDTLGWVQTATPVRRWRRRFSILWRPAEWRHRLELKHQPTWTLVLRLRRRRVWGFFTKDGWLDWRSYGKEWCD